MTEYSTQSGKPNQKYDCKATFSAQVAGQLLNPVGSEFTATFVGRLVTTLIQRTGDRLGENLDLLLKAVLSKLQGSQTLSVIQVGSRRV